ncbi:MAG: glutamate mutase L [Bacillota bacterium]
MLCLSTSSAGGGLQVMVFGVMRNVTAESAKKAALGGGAIILDVMTTDDNRSTFLKLESIKKSRPDMIPISGGIDGGNTAFALEIADVLNAAKPRPRFGTGYKIPVIFAGNKDAAPFISDTLSDNFDVRVVDNLRPDFETEVLEPTRQAIREWFISHVMAHAPGYRKLCEWVDSDVVPRLLQLAT